MSFIQKLSFTTIGIPSKSLKGFPFLYLFDDPIDFLIANSDVVVVNAFIFFKLSILLKHFLIISCGSNFPDL